MTNFGINGFGRIGRTACRVWWLHHQQNSDLKMINTSGSMELEDWVYLLKRPSNSKFMPNAHVFPGGRVDLEDIKNSKYISNLKLNLAAYKIAAMRECLEESSIKLNNINSLVSFSHWITPEIEPRRYDTRFFITQITSEQYAQTEHSTAEATEGIWISPQEALNRFEKNQIFLAPPTYLSLKSINKSKTYSNCLKSIKYPNSPIQPEFCEIKSNNKTRKILCLPGDKLFSDQSAQQVYSKTRFEFIEGRFR